MKRFITEGEKMKIGIISAQSNLKMNILYVLPYIPKPVSGGPVRDYNIIKYLSEAGVNLQVVCNADPDDETTNITSLERELNTKIYTTKAPDIHIFKKIKIVLFNRMYPPICRYNTLAHKKMISSMIKNNSFDIIHVNQHTIEAAPAIWAISNTHFKGCKIISAHNVDYLNFIKQVDLYKNPLIRLARKRVAVKLKEYEFNMISKFDHLIVVSNVDKDIYISKGVPEDKIDIIPNGVDCNYFDPLKLVNKVTIDQPNILFMGTLTYQPNVIAIKAYLQHIHPIIKKEVPKIKFYVIGKNCPEWLKEHSKIDNSVEIIGFVEDVRPYIINANVCIAPLTRGSGTRLKILEYMAMSKPVVSTTIGAEGLKVENNKNILIVDDWSEFADKIIDLLNDEERAKTIGENGRKLVEEKYDWKKISEKQMRVYEKVLER
jgi:glycosyltransferase involved in cell wall biosynthesis